MPRMPDHPADGTLRGYLDGELDARSTLRCAVHLRTCAGCRQALSHVRQDGERVAQLLTALGTDRRRPRRLPYIGATVGVAAAGVLSFALLHRPPSTHSRVAAGARVQDVCCFNLDGGTLRDDGMLTVSRPGQVVDCVVLYEDRAGRGAFVPGDPLRFISQPNGCGDFGRSGS